MELAEGRDWASASVAAAWLVPVLASRSSSATSASGASEQRYDSVGSSEEVSEVDCSCQFNKLSRWCLGLPDGSAEHC